jgi:hypothetical protein
MAINLAYLEYRLSGGSSNTDPTQSLGGQMSTHANGRIVGRTTTGLSNVTGVTILDAPNSAIGNGTLAYTASGTTATWAGNGASAGSPINIGSTGRYILQDSAGGRLHIDVTSGSLPGGNQSDTITVAAKANGLFDNITGAESLAGDTEYRCFYVKNAHATDALYDVKIYIGTQTSGDDAIQIGLDLAGVGDGSATGVADTIADENTAPDPAVSFSTAADLSNGLNISQLSAGECRAVWQKRVVPSSTSNATTSDTSTLIVSASYS